MSKHQSQGNPRPGPELPANFGHAVPRGGGMRRKWQLVWGRVAITLLMGAAAYRLIPAATVRQAGLAAYHAWAFRHLAY